MGQKIDLLQQVQGILPEANGGAGPNIGQRFADAETPSGTLNGVNTTFSLVRAPNPALSLMLFLSKTLQIQGVDYTLSGATITMTVAPPGATSSFLGWYRYLGFGLTLTFSDGLSMSDALAMDALVARIPLSTQDQMTLTDFVLFTMGPIVFMDTLVMTDSIAILAPFPLSLSDTRSLTDAFLKQFGRILQLSDTMTLADSATVTLI